MILCRVSRTVVCHVLIIWIEGKPEKKFVLPQATQSHETHRILTGITNILALPQGTTQGKPTNYHRVPLTLKPQDTHWHYYRTPTHTKSTRYLLMMPQAFLYPLTWNSLHAYLHYQRISTHKITRSITKGQQHLRKRTTPLSFTDSHEFEWI